MALLMGELLQDRVTGSQTTNDHELTFTYYTAS